MNVHFAKRRVGDFNVNNLVMSDCQCLEVANTQACINHFDKMADDGLEADLLVVVPELISAQ